ncbi:MAG: hypothetical protein U1E23_14365 [Reyranellaceae bacterium]
MSKLTALSRHEFLVRERRLLRDIGRRSAALVNPAALAKPAAVVESWRAPAAAPAAGKPTLRLRPA